MVLRREDIEAQSFKEVWRGYDQQEVDRFLDRVAESIVALTRERDDLAARLQRIQGQAAEALESESLLKRTLVAAQRTADSTIEDAKRQGAELVSDAQQRAVQAVEDARSEAEEIRAKARYDANRSLSRAAAEVERVRHAVADLRRLRNEYREQVRAVIAEHLALLERAGDVPDLPAELVDLASLPDVAAPAEPDAGRPPAAGDAEGLDAAGDLADARGGDS